jgi:hypothetical protein
MESVTYKEKPAIQAQTALSSKGQVIIVAAARKKYLPDDMDGFTEDVFRDGTIVLKPKRKFSEKEIFVREAEAYYEVFGREDNETQDKGFLDAAEAGGEVVD